MITEAHRKARQEEIKAVARRCLGHGAVRSCYLALNGTTAYVDHCDIEVEIGGDAFSFDQLADLSYRLGTRLIDIVTRAGFGGSDVTPAEGDELILRVQWKGGAK